MTDVIKCFLAVVALAVGGTALLALWLALVSTIVGVPALVVWAVVNFLAGYKVSFWLFFAFFFVVGVVTGKIRLRVKVKETNPV